MLFRHCIKAQPRNFCIKCFSHKADFLGLASWELTPVSLPDSSHFRHQRLDKTAFPTIRLSADSVMVVNRGRFLSTLKISR